MSHKPVGRNVLQCNRIWFLYGNCYHAQCPTILEYIYSSLSIATFRKDKKNVFQQLVVNHFLKHLLATSEIQNAKMFQGCVHKLRSICNFL